MCEKAQSATSSSPVAPETATFGRGPELARLGAWLDGGERLVTVMGGGGIGKTRLASELARARRGGAEVVFVALGEARDALDAMSAVARELDAGIGGAGLEQLGRGVGRALRARGPLLLVLDGLERVVAPLAPFIDGWLDVAPDAQLLVTSRERLLVPGERVLIVPPLAVGADARGPAVALFRARAATAGAEVAAWDDAEQRALVELVSRLDGLPLAIELAAARAASAPPSRLLVELERRFEVLGPAAGDARAPGMEEVLEASWAPLPADAKDALARLSVLASPFDLEAAAAVLGRDELAALDLVALLRRRSLVVAGRAPGDLQLLETVRDFARARAGAAGLDVEDDAVRRRDDWVLGRATALLDARRGPDGARALRALSRLHEQLLAVVRDHAAGGASSLESALRAAYALAISVRVTGAAASDHAGLAALAERAVAAGVALAHVAPALLLVARIDYDHGRLEAGLAVAHRVLELAGEASPWAPEAILLEARRAFVLGEFAPSLPLWERGRDAAIAAGDAEMEAIARLNHALTRVRLGERDGVEAEVERAHALLVGVGAHHQLPIQRGYAFNVATALGDREGARASLVDGLRVAREVGSARDEIGFGVYLALVELDASRFAPAAVAAEAAFRRAILAHEHLAGHSARLAAQIAVERGELDTARQWTDECRALLRVTGREIDGALAEAVEVARRALAGDVAGARTLARSVDAATLGADNGVAIAARGVASVALAAEALAARRAGADAAADALLAAVDAQAARLRDASGTSDDARRALSLVARAIGAARGDDGVLCVAPDRSAFRLGRRPFEDLAKKPTLARLFAALLAARLDRGGAPLDLAELAEAGWPGERMLDAARDNRLYVTLSKLRKAGLEGALEHDGSGWRLRPDVGVLFVEPAAWSVVDGP